MQGRGRVRDLVEAASLSTNLESLLEQFAGASTRSAQLALLDQLIAAWAETSDMTDFSTRFLDHGYYVQFESIGNEQAADHQDLEHAVQLHF